jgi:hypothetical protein
MAHRHSKGQEAAGAGQSIVQYALESEAFKNYLNLAVEYLERDWQRLLPAKQLGWDQVMHYHYGPKRVLGGVLFQVVCKNVQSVEIAGDFNQWIPELLLQREEGLWQKVMMITRGTYRYKFIVDGQWQMDPYQPLQRLNAFGTLDSYLELH